MGIGNVLTEKLIFDKKGRLITNGTWEYKPPDTKTIPQVVTHISLIVCRYHIFFSACTNYNKGTCECFKSVF